MLALAFLVLASTAAETLSLVGVAGRADRRVAVLRSGSRSQVVAAGERAFGATVVAVEASHVVLDIEGRRVAVGMSRNAVTPSPAVAPSPAPAPTASSMPAFTLGPDDIPPVKTLSRAEVERRLAAEIPRILAQTSVQPVRENGLMVGVSFSRLPPGSLLMEAGLQAGDVLTRLNGVDIDSMGTLAGLWLRLQAAPEFNASVLRAGQPVELTVQLR